MTIAYDTVKQPNGRSWSTACSKHSNLAVAAEIYRHIVPRRGNVYVQETVEV